MKRKASRGILGARVSDCKAHPDEKGIETGRLYFHTVLVDSSIARPIPTKRELKHGEFPRTFSTNQNCKAHPDEKGIET